MPCNPSNRRRNKIKPKKRKRLPDDDPSVCYINTFTPLVASAAGRMATQSQGLPPFIDGSIRREPDLEHTFPSISCLCRADKFAPRLRPGNLVAYLTKKARYGAEYPRHWRLIAVLEVITMFDSHPDAATWYASQGLALPSNCMVDGNPPEPLFRSHRINKDAKRLSDDRLLRTWDLGYRHRAREFPLFLACKKRHSTLDFDAPVILEQHLLGAFGRIPGTHNPGRLPNDQFMRFLRSVGVKLT